MPNPETAGEVLHHGDRQYLLERFPHETHGRLRAWDAADEYLLNAYGSRAERDRTLVVEDGFGALAVALHGARPTSWGDSWLARRAAQRNHEINGLDWTDDRFVTADDEPVGKFNLVLLKIPKSLSYFEDLLLRMRAHLAEDAVVVAGGMIKHVPMRSWKLLEQVIGPTATSRGWKKARLGEARFDHAVALAPCIAEASYAWGAPPLQLVDGPNLFSRGRLDRGTALLADHLPRTTGPVRAADLGCGNGILALAVARACPAARILAVDTSFQAVACARANVVRAGLHERIECRAGDGLSDTEPGSLDLVVCNPPFHHDRTVGDQLAWRMFTGARRALANGGRVLLVGNRHLGYHAKLARLFGHSRNIAADRKFVVLEATRP